MFKDVIANPEDTKVTSFASVDEMTTSILDGANTQGNQRKVKYGHNKGQPRKTQEVPETTFLQIKTIAFEIAKHLFDPHASFVVTNGDPRGGQVSGQQPWLSMSRLPEGQKVSLVLILLGQLDCFKPNALSRLDDQFINALPGLCRRAANLVAALLAQSVVPSPVLEQVLQGSKLTVTTEHDLCTSRNQLINIVQQCILFIFQPVIGIVGPDSGYNRIKAG